MRIRSSLAASFLLALVTAPGCLEGDPNPLANEDAGTRTSSSGQPAPVPTVTPSGQCSGDGTQAVNLPFRNNFTDRSVRLFWVNQRCTEIAYAVLAPGVSTVQQTYIAHVWRVRDASTGALYEEFIPTTTAPPEVAVP